MSLDIRDVFFPSAKRLRQMGDTKPVIITTTMCMVMSAVALALSNAGDYTSEQDLATWTPAQVEATTRDYIKFYESELGIGGKIMNYGLYRSAKNHTDSKQP